MAEGKRYVETSRFLGIEMTDAEKGIAMMILAAALLAVVCFFGYYTILFQTINLLGMGAAVLAAKSPIPAAVLLGTALLMYTARWLRMFSRAPQES